MRDPLLHFILMGIAIFGLHRLWREDTVTVRVTAEMVAAAEDDFSQRFGRAPEDDERAQILAQLIDEEVLYREGQALSLAEGDPVLRRRLIAQMRLLMASAAPRHPSEAELEAMLAAHPERYTRPPTRTLEHVFLDAARHAELTAAVQGAEAALRAGADPASVGDPFLHGRQMTADEAALAARFGQSFAAQAFTLPLGEWLLVHSRYGAHWVYVESVTPARPASLDEARAALLADWQEQARADAEEAAMASIRARYRVQLP